MADKLEDVPIWLTRSVLFVVFVPCLLWVALSEAGKELKSLHKYIWWACAEFVSGVKFMWKHGRVPEEGQW